MVPVAVFCAPNFTWIIHFNAFWIQWHGAFHTRMIKCNIKNAIKVPLMYAQCTTSSELNWISVRFTDAHCRDGVNLVKEMHASVKQKTPFDMVWLKSYISTGVLMRSICVKWSDLNRNSLRSTDLKFSTFQSKYFAWGLVSMRKSNHWACRLCVNSYALNKLSSR